MVGIRFGAGAEFDRLAERLKRAGREDVVLKELSKVLDDAYPGLHRDVIAGTRRLPQRGGLAALTARTRLDRRVLRRKNGYVLQIKAATNVLKDPAAIDRGRIRRPTYGHQPYIIQLTAPGWFTQPLLLARPRIAAELTKNIPAMLRKI